MNLFLPFAVYMYQLILFVDQRTRKSEAKVHVDMFFEKKNAWTETLIKKVTFVPGKLLFVYP